jgi:hypothetical protein
MIVMAPQGDQRNAERKISARQADVLMHAVIASVPVGAIVHINVRGDALRKPGRGAQQRESNDGENSEKTKD